MKLRHLSIASIALCLLGLIALLVISIYVTHDIRDQQRQVGELFSLEQRVSALATASTHLLLYYPDDELRQAFASEANAIRQEFQELDQEQPGAGRVARHIDLVQAMLDVEHGRFASSRAEVDGFGPLGLPRRSRIIMGQMTGHGIALESAVTALLQERQTDIARQTTWAVGSFSVASLLFGALCVVAFTVIHRRVRGPVSDLSLVVQRLAAGDRDARVAVRGTDELSELGESFNDLLDQQQRARAELERYESELEERARMLAESQRIARVGSMRLHMDTQRLRWSDESCRIFGLEPHQFTGRVQDFLAQIHPDDLEAFLEKRVRALRGECNVDAEYRIIRPDGSIRLVHQRAELERDKYGKPQFLVGTLQDVTEQREDHERMREQQLLLDTAGRVARFGGWSVDPSTQIIHWSDTLCDIHEVPRGTIVSLEQGIGFYAPEYRNVIRRLYLRCVETGAPFDAEMEAFTATGRRIWVRATGEAVHDRAGSLMRVQGALQDITEHKKAEYERQRIATELRTTMDNIDEAFFTLDSAWRFTYCNNEACRLLKQERGDLLGAGIWERFPDLEHSAVGIAYRHAVTSDEQISLDAFWYEPLHGWFDIRAYPSDSGLAVFFADVTERHRMIQRLRDQEAALRRSRDKLAALLRSRQALINSLPAHIALLAPDGRIVDVNANWRSFALRNAFGDDRLGVGENYLAVCEQARGEEAGQARELAAALRAVLAGQRDSFSQEYPCHSPEEERWFRVSVNQLSRASDEHGEPGAVVMHMDITERRRAERYLNRLAFEDPLTQVLSRNGFAHELAATVERRGWDKRGMVVMLDLINLRHVNDAHGFAVGDRLLQQIGQRLNLHAGKHGLVGRAGGDEFMAYLPGEARHPDTLRQRLMTAFQTPYDVDGFPVEIVARFGYTYLADGPRPVEQLLREAELALFQGGDYQDQHRWAAYNAKLDAETRERVHITRELRRALDEDQFQLHFQPKVEMNTGRIIGAEALLRWRHPARGMVPPVQFIPIAEQSQLIGPIGQWVVQAACRSLAEWQAAGLDIVRIAVNVSVREFRLGSYTRTVLEALQCSGVKPEALSLEITESVFERAEDALLSDLRGLHQEGIRLSLDDFGTGYSSLLYLQRYPFDEIKIDRGFVRGMLDDHYSREIVRTVIGVARVINAEVVAEGVETAAEKAMLLEMGCRIGQGYYYSKPVPEADFRSLLEKRVHLPIPPAKR